MEDIVAFTGGPAEAGMLLVVEIEKKPGVSIHPPPRWTKVHEGDDCVRFEKVTGIHEPPSYSFARSRA